MCWLGTLFTTKKLEMMHQKIIQDVGMFSCLLCFYAVICTKEDEMNEHQYKFLLVKKWPSFTTLLIKHCANEKAVHYTCCLRKPGDKWACWSAFLFHQTYFISGIPDYLKSTLWDFFLLAKNPLNSDNYVAFIIFSKADLVFFMLEYWLLHVDDDGNCC